MTSLLDQFIPTATAFRPSTARELFALRLAQKLNDSAAVRHYVDLAETYSEGQILCAYRRTGRAHPNPDPGRHFHLELQKSRGNGHRHGAGTLLSIRVERRTVAIVIFDGEHIEYTDARQLSSDRDKAAASAANFVGWILNRFSVDSAALESIFNGHEMLRHAIHDAVCATLRDHILPVWEVSKAALLECYGRPALRSRSELRQIATTIWPILSGARAKVFIQDAAILGLHVQIDRLFIIN